MENNYKNFTELLVRGKNIRVTYNKMVEDGFSPSGWWLQELWRYNKKTNLIECYYPESSYKKDFYTSYTQEDAESYMRMMVSDYKRGELTFSIEDDVLSKIKEGQSVLEIAIEELRKMDDDEIFRRVFV